MPSDTLYALSAAASDAEAVRRVFDFKGREGGRPLPLFVSDVAMAERIGVASTIVDCTGDQPQILRAGAISAEAIAEALAEAGE